MPPIAYVVPTNDMLIKAGKYIDTSGRCLIEYIQHWEKKSEVSIILLHTLNLLLIRPIKACSLSALLEAMQEQFSRDPPVYAKPKNAPMRPMSSQIVSSDPRVTSPPATSSDRPVLPPKPGSVAPPVIPQRPSSIPTSPAVPAQVLPQPHASLANRPPPPLPSADSRPPQYVNATPPADYAASRNASTSPYPRPTTGWSAQVAPMYQPVVSPPPISAPPPPQPQQAWSPPHQAPPPIPNLLDEESQPSATSSPPPSLVTHLPPRPPNPELQRLHAQIHQKLDSELAALSHAMALDAARLRAHQADLLSGEPTMRDEMARLEAVRDVCRTVAGRMRGSVEQGERNIAELRRKGDPEVDELVCSTTIVHNQLRYCPSFLHFAVWRELIISQRLINLVAEDNAIEDTIYHLHRALNTGRIDLDRFLRVCTPSRSRHFCAYM